MAAGESGSGSSAVAKAMADEGRLAVAVCSGVGSVSKRLLSI